MQVKELFGRPLDAQESFEEYFDGFPFERGFRILSHVLSTNDNYGLHQFVLSFLFGYHDQYVLKCVACYLFKVLCFDIIFYSPFIIVSPYPLLCDFCNF